jgi:hypothetical protein
MHKPPTWYYLVAGLITFWALIGCYAYLSQVSMSADDLAQLPAQQREIWAMMPAWVTGAYASAVWIGLAGAICLLIRLRIAQTLFIVSLAAVIVQFGWTFAATPILSTMGGSAAIFPLVIAAIGAFEIWFSRMAATRRWLR